MKNLTCLLIFITLCFHTSSFNSEATVRHFISDNSGSSIVSLNEGIDPLQFEDSLHHLYAKFGLGHYDLSFEAFRYAMIGYYTLLHEGRLKNNRLLTIIDFTKSSAKKRFYTLDMETRTIKFNTYVSHGKNTGGDLAKSFSNKLHSNQSSLGFYVTGETYVGSKGYSLKLDGIESGYNDNLRTRAVVIHDADYVSENWIDKYGRLGRSQGCPALPKEVSREIIDAIKNQTAIFAYYNDQHYLSSSSYLNLTRLLSSPIDLASLNR